METNTIGSYAGDMGKPEGVKIFITSTGQNEINDNIIIQYYAWNDRSGPGNGYGTMKVDIVMYYNGEKVSFASIKGSEDGKIQDKVGNVYACGELIGKELIERRDHNWYRLTIKLNESFCNLIALAMVSFSYSASVNNTRTNDNDKKNICSIIMATNEKW